MFIRSLHFHFRDKLAFTQSRAASYFFDGSSYAVVRDITRRGKFGQVTRFDIEVRTPADNGLVLLMVNGVSKNKSSASLLPVLSAIHVSRNLPRLNVPCHQTEVLIQKAKLVFFFFREVMSAISKSSHEMHFPALHFRCVYQISLEKLREF